jgi:hypothetical protein
LSFGGEAPQDLAATALIALALVAGVSGRAAAQADSDSLPPYMAGDSLQMAGDSLPSVAPRDSRLPALPVDSLPSAAPMDSLSAAAPGVSAPSDMMDSVPSDTPTPDDSIPLAEPLPIPEKPAVHQFRVAAEGLAFNWDEGAQVDDGMLVAFDVERDLAPFLAARGSLAYGTSEVRPRSEGNETLDVRLFLPELNLMLQHELRVSSHGRLTPYVLAGFGSLVSDPKDEGTTRSQNAFSYGGGARMRFGERFGVRGEIKRYEIKEEDLLDSTAQSSETVHAWRLAGSLIYAL